MNLTKVIQISVNFVILLLQSYNHPREYTFKLNPLQPVGYYDKNPLYTHMLAITRLMNTLKFISEMVSCENNDAITIKMSDLLGPVFRMLQVCSSVLQFSVSNDMISYCVQCFSLSVGVRSLRNLFLFLFLMGVNDRCIF